VRGQVSGASGEWFRPCCINDRLVEQRGLYSFLSHPGIVKVGRAGLVLGGTKRSTLYL